MVCLRIIWCERCSSVSRIANYILENSTLWGCQKKAIGLHILISYLGYHFHSRKLKAPWLFLGEKLGERWLCSSDWPLTPHLGAFMKHLHTWRNPFILVVLYKLMINRRNICFWIFHKWEPQIVVFGLELDQILWFNLTAKFPGLGFPHTKRAFRIPRRGRGEVRKSRGQKLQVHYAWNFLNAWKKTKLF